MLGEGENNGGTGQGGQMEIFITVLDAAGNPLDGAQIVNEEQQFPVNVVSGEKGAGKAQITMYGQIFRLKVASLNGQPVSSEVTTKLGLKDMDPAPLIGKLGDVCTTIDNCPPWPRRHFSYILVFKRRTDRMTKILESLMNSMTPADLARYIARNNIDAELITNIGHTPTVPMAAAALGVDVDRILKTLLFYIGGKPYVVINHGLGLVSTKVLAAHFGIGKRQVKLARPQQVLAETGYAVGGVPPIGHRNSLPVLMAQSILDYDIIFGGGGDDKTMLRIATSELLRLLNPTLLSFQQSNS